jgi:hypothetical protein
VTLTHLRRMPQMLQLLLQCCRRNIRSALSSPVPVPAAAASDAACGAICSPCTPGCAGPHWFCLPPLQQLLRRHSRCNELPPPVMHTAAQHQQHIASRIGAGATRPCSTPGQPQSRNATAPLQTPCSHQGHTTATAYVPISYNSAVICIRSLMVLAGAIQR